MPAAPKFTAQLRFGLQHSQSPPRDWVFGSSSEQLGFWLQLSEVYGVQSETSEFNTRGCPGAAHWWRVITLIRPDILATSDDFTKINIKLGQSPQGIFTQHSFLGRITEKQTETNIHIELEERGQSHPSNEENVTKKHKEY